MKNFKMFLCSLFVLIIGCFAFVGCEKPTDNTPPYNSGEITETPTESTDTTLTLAEAKEMVVSALAVSEADGQMLATVPVIGNRNIFVKLKNVEISFSNEASDTSSFDGEVQRINSNWSKYSLSSNDMSEYYDGDNVYVKNGEEKSKTTYSNAYFGNYILPLLDCIYVDLLFIENAWATIYESEATKSVKDYGFMLTMDVNMSKYVDFVMQECESMGLDASEALFGDGDYRQKNKDEGSVELAIRFDKHLNIIGLDFLINCLGASNNVWNFYESKIILNKCEELSAPDWFNPSDYE